MVALNKTYQKTLTPDRSAKDAGRRYYSPEISRWLNRDPLGERGGGSLYLFVRNDPIRSTDLLGLVEPDWASGWDLSRLQTLTYLLRGPGGGRGVGLLYSADPSLTDAQLNQLLDYIQVGLWGRSCTEALTHFSYWRSGEGPRPTLSYTLFTDNPALRDDVASLRTEICSSVRGGRQERFWGRGTFRTSGDPPSVALLLGGYSINYFAVPRQSGRVSVRFSVNDPYDFSPEQFALTRVGRTPIVIEDDVLILARARRLVRGDYPRRIAWREVINCCGAEPLVGAVREVHFRD